MHLTPTKHPVKMKLIIILFEFSNYIPITALASAKISEGYSVAPFHQINLKFGLYTRLGVLYLSFKFQVSILSGTEAEVILQIGWTAVKRDNALIPWDLEGTPLQIKTNSTLGSDERIWVLMYDKDSSSIGGVAVQFSSPIKYGINYCITNQPDLPVQPPVEVEKIWTITKTKTALIVTCNNVEVVNYLFADSPLDSCVTRWGGDLVNGIKFVNDFDTASDFYICLCPTVFASPMILDHDRAPLN
eukprot:sb/3468926/